MLIRPFPPAETTVRRLCLLLAFGSMACSAGAVVQPDEDPDSNGDGISDALLSSARCIVDANADGQADDVDLDGDGVIDGKGFDDGCDGVADGYGVDSDGDGVIDKIILADGGTVDTPKETDDKPKLEVNDGTGGGTGTEGGEYCQDFDVDFVPKVPTVMVVVDRSSTMFQATDFWGTLKAAVLPVIEDLQSDVRFGFASYTGVRNMCQGLSTPTDFAFDNYAAIRAAYDALGNPMDDLGDKGETPTAVAIEQARELLLADAAKLEAAEEPPSEKYILLVSDGDADFCNDPAAQCAADAVVAALQLAATEGVRTLVFGIESDQLEHPEWFDFFAQAGAGEKPAWTDALTISTYTGKLESECSSMPEWADYREANGNAPDPTQCNTPEGQNQPPEGNAECYLPAGNYDPAGGSASAFLSTDTAALAAQIKTTVSGLKSCVFDLSGSGVEVVAGQEATGEIFVSDVQISADQWRMNTTQELELLGAACTTWQDPATKKFFAGFPCEALKEVVK